MNLLRSSRSYSPSPQFAPEKLAGGGARDRFHQDIFFRPLEPGQASFQAHVVELCRRETGSRRLDEGHDFGAEALVGQADDRATSDQMASCQRVLYFFRIDVLAAADDHIVHAADDVELAVLVEFSEVAGAVPTTFNSLDVGVRALPVTGKRLRAIHASDDLAGGAGRQIGPDVIIAVRRHDANDLVHPGPPGATGLAVEMVAIAEGVDLA